MSKTVKLLTLVLTNYRNIDFATFNFNGEWSKIVGENRIGKTNTLEAIHWLLTDKLLTGSSDVAAIKPLVDTKREVRVEATFDVDGKTFTLKKEYGENWARTRGTDQLEMKGHYTTYYFNGVKQSTVRAYQTLVNETFGITYDFGKIDIIRALIDPSYLGELGEDKDWTELRNFIINIIGDVQDSDVIASNPKLSLIQEDLTSVDGRIDQLKKRYKGEIDGLNETIIGNDAQIKMLEETPKPTEDELSVAKKMVEETEEKINKLQGEKSQDSAVSFLNHQIVEKEKEINQCTSQLLSSNPLLKEQKEKEEEARTLMSNISNIKSSIWTLTSDLKSCQTSISLKKLEIEQTETKKAKLLGDYHTLTDKIKHPDANTSLVCPTCNRPFENKDEIINSMVKQWSQEREKVLAEGKNLASSIETMRIDLGVLETQEKNFKYQIEEKEKELKTLESDLDKVNKQKCELFDKAHDYKPQSEELDILNRQLSELKEKLESTNKNDESKNAAIRDSINQLNADVEPYRAIIQKHGYWKISQDQLATVKETRKSNALKLASTEQKRELLNTFIYAKLQMLDERVATIFGNIKFQLIKENINGGFDTVCKPYIYDIDKDQSTLVLWKSGSKSERIVTGIAIAERIKTALDLPNLPFLFDEGGEISTDTFSNKFKTDAQLICVKVQDNIKHPTVLKI